MTEDDQNLKAIYHRRFGQTAAYPNRLWQERTASFFGSWNRLEGMAAPLHAGRTLSL